MDSAPLGIKRRKGDTRTRPQQGKSGSSRVDGFHIPHSTGIVAPISDSTAVLLLPIEWGACCCLGHLPERGVGDPHFTLSFSPFPPTFIWYSGLSRLRLARRPMSLKAYIVNLAAAAKNGRASGEARWSPRVVARPGGRGAAWSVH